MKSLLCFLWLLAYSAVVFAEDMMYNVLTVDPLSPEMSMGVLVDGNYFSLHNNDSIPLLFSGIAPKSIKSYKYTMIRTESKGIVATEEFDRPAQFLTENRSFNDVFGQSWHRMDQMNTLPQLYSFDKDKYSPKGGNSDPAASYLYEEGTVATLHFSAAPEDIDKLHTYKMSKHVKLRGDFIYINYDTIQEFKNVSFRVGGHSSRHLSKIPYKVKISNKVYPEGLFRRWNFKLRPESTDPTMVREKLYNDILQSTGVVAARGAYTRFYINGEPIGLYLIVDDTSSSTFIRETFYAGNRTRIGAIIKADASEGTTAANLNYLGDNSEAYEKEIYDIKKESPEGSPSALDGLIKLTKFVKEYDPSSVPNDHRAVALWEEHLDMTSFIRQLAIEWITGNWDAHQYSGNNYLIHRHSIFDQYVLIPVDFDYTFGNGIEEDQIPLLTGEPLKMTDGRIVHSYLWEKVKATPYLAKLYEETIKDITTQLATPDILNARIDALVALIEKSVEWDRTLQPKTVGTMTNQNIHDFHAAFNEATPNRIDQLFGLKQWIKIKYNTVQKLYA